MINGDSYTSDCQRPEEWFLQHAFPKSPRIGESSLWTALIFRVKPAEPCFRFQTISPNGSGNKTHSNTKHCLEEEEEKEEEEETEAEEK